jgi:hypothetical protein
VNYFRKTFKTVSDAEEEFSIDYEDICTTNISDDSGFIEVSTPSTPATPYSVENFVDYYLSKFSKEQVTTIWKKLGKEVAINEKVQTLRSVLSEHELINIIHTASSNCREQILISNFTSLHPEHQKQSLDKLFEMSAYNEGLKAGTDKFVSLSIQAMKTLKKKGKPNAIKDFVKCLGLTRLDSQEPLMPVDRMPFGLIQHQIQFFCASDIRQVNIVSIIFSYIYI